jgi:hypothetical protein
MMAALDHFITPARLLLTQLTLLAVAWANLSFFKA